MALEGLTEEDIEHRKSALLQALRNLEGSAGNVTLLRQLQWPEDIYWGIRDLLVDAGTLQLGKGKGGSVRIVEEVPQAAAPPAIQAAEADLYEPMAGVIRDQWSKDQRFGQSLVEVLARQGRRDTGGTWTRPDIVIVSLTTLLYLPGKRFDVVTFEVKPWNGLDVTAIYEALAHHRAATRSYVLAHVPDEQQRTEYDQRLLDRIEEEAKRHGIGLIVAANPQSYETWEERVEAVFREPSPHVLNDFISVQFTEGAKQTLSTWFR